MIAHAVLNEESFEAGESRDDVTVLALLKTFQALQGAVIVVHQAFIKAYLVKAIYDIKLPSGNMLIGVLSSLRAGSKTEIQQLRNILLKAVHTRDETGTIVGPESDTEVKFGALPASRETPSLRAAWVLRGLAWSAAHARWQIEEIPLQVRDAPGTFRQEKVANAYCSNLGPAQRTALARTLTVLPEFADEDRRHDPTHADYIDRKKSHIPKYARRILTYAVPTAGGATWWALCACGYYHRFMGSQQQGEVGRMRVHWNGTTNPNATGNQQAGQTPTTASQVPDAVKKQLAENAKVRSLANDDCGCRERPGRS